MAIARLRPGTRIAVEGPYGSFTKHAIHGRGVALIGAGTGATPIRALLEDLPTGTDTVVLLRASSRDELLLADEIAALTGELTGRALALLRNTTRDGARYRVEHLCPRPPCP